MQRRVRVRRERPSALAWAIALAVTMLAVYLITLGVPATKSDDHAEAKAPRVTRELTFGGAELYFADLGVYDSASRARMAAAALTDRGAAGCVYGDGGGWHVLGAAYASRADAERIASRLGEQEGIETGVLSLTAPDISMRITAAESDVAAIGGAYDALRAQLEQAGAMALRMDRGELSVSSARMLAAVSASELRSAERALAEVPGAGENPLCSGLLQLLKRLAAAFDVAAEKTSSAAVASGRLRLCHVDGFVQLIDFLQTGLASGSQPGSGRTTIARSA